MSEKGSYAHVGLPGLRELFAGGGKGMKEEREIRVTLHDGSEVVFNTGDRVLFQASTPGAIPLAVDADTIADDLLLTLEQANQKLSANSAAIQGLRELLKQTITKLPDELYQKAAEYDLIKSGDHPDWALRSTEDLRDINFLEQQLTEWRAQAEAKILFVSNGNNERMYELQEDNLALRKALEEQRPEVRWFADRMEAKLKENDYKRGWDHDRYSFFLKKIESRLHDLSSAVANVMCWNERDDLTSREVDRLIDSAANLANYAMMIANKARKELGEGDKDGN
ncbi:hypothetical protein ACE3MQ_25110 [Paenibacillus lentus]|uniref:hypothetical protein n=1 Tax=Paenibacillus lentus TaxID=1338368 RepID=UPI00365D783E